MRRFVGRRKELSMLENLYESSEYRTCMVVGIRRVGKTALLNRFCEGKRHLIFPCEYSSEQSNVRMMSKELSKFEGKEVRPESFQDAMDRLRGVCEDGKTVIVFDEFSYLIRSFDGASTIVQHFIDWMVDNTDSMLVICGSIRSDMNDEVSDAGRPLYGRFPNRLDLEPLTLPEVAEMHPNMSDTDILRLYLTIGGVPQYNNMLNMGTYRENIESNFLDDGRLLDDAAYNDVFQEFRRRDWYIPVLNAIGSGARTLKEISEGSGHSIQLTGRYIEDLERTGIVRQQVPMAGAPARKRYLISSPIVAFNHAVLIPDAVLIRGGGDQAYSLIESDINTHLGGMFEGFCIDFVTTHYPCRKIGSWWGTMETEDGEKVGTDIDIVADAKQGDLTIRLYGECKLRKRKAGFSDLNSLSEKVKAIKGNVDNYRLMLISASGFEEDLEDHAKEAKVILIGMDELLGRAPVPVIPL